MSHVLLVVMPRASSSSKRNVDVAKAKSSLKSVDIKLTYLQEAIAP